MSHRAWRRRLHSSLEDRLSGQEGAALRAHLASCAACRSELRALEAVEALIGRLPAALVPLGAGAEADARLALLARWSTMSVPPRPARFVSRRALGATLAAASLLVAVWLGPLGAGRPAVEEPGASLTVASLVSTSILPAFDSSSATPYTWR